MPASSVVLLIALFTTSTMTRVAPVQMDPATAGLPGADTMHARGTFDVQLTPQDSDAADGSTLGRLSMVKQFEGDLAGSSQGEMLTATTALDGSAGYVAIERVTAVLNGRRGTFVLQHSGTMSRGEQQLSISIVPDSGTGDLEGIGGIMTIQIANGIHSYELAYTLP